MYTKLKILLLFGFMIGILNVGAQNMEEQPTWQAEFDQWFTLPNHRDMAVSYTAHINQRYDHGMSKTDQPRLNLEFDFLLWAKGDSQIVIVEIKDVLVAVAQGHLRHVLGDVEELKNAKLTYVKRDNDFISVDEDVDDSLSKLDYELRQSILPLLLPEMPTEEEPPLRSEMEWDTNKDNKQSTLTFSNNPPIVQWSVAHVEAPLKGGEDEPGLALIRGDRLFSRRTRNDRNMLAYSQANIWYDNEAQRVRSADHTTWRDQRRVVSWRPPSEMYSSAVRVYETQRIRD